MVTFEELLREYSEGNKLTNFHKLMQHRCRELLLIATPYDAFMLAEDSKLSELILSEFIELNLRYAPGVKTVSSGEEALRLAEDTSRFNLIITMMHMEDMDVLEFARRLRAKGITTPVMLLAYDNRELMQLKNAEDARLLDRMFVWQGDFRILLSMIKLFEDEANIEYDTKNVGVQVILLVEDNIRFYSSYLPIIYTEVIKQSQALISEGVNLTQKILRMRARPKILLANTYEEALAYYNEYRENILGIISDIKFPHNGELDPDAGMKLTRMIKSESPDIPILLQSTDERNRPAAEEAGAAFIYKYSPTLLHELRQFMVNNFAFGDFIFRMPDGREVGRARDLREMEEMLKVIPEESLKFHAEGHHFSKWLKARTEFLLAEKIKPGRVSDYPSLDAVRKYLVDTLHEFRLRRYRGIVVDFNPNDTETSFNIARIGYGSIGGKARGMAFVSMLLNDYGVRHAFDGIKIFVPAAVVLATDVFDEFMDRNNLTQLALNSEDEEEIKRRFLDARLPEYVEQNLWRLLEIVDYPLAVRSSSILEDSMYQPFAGVYETYMVPNNHPDIGRRFEQLTKAIKLVYASTYSNAAKTYIRSTTFRLEEEKMAVIIQRIVGQHHGMRYYPDFSGVIRSHNSYPIPPMKPEDGVVSVALGLGKAIVDGGSVLSFCPKYPNQILQLSKPEDYLNYTQKDFFALDLSIEKQEQEGESYTEPELLKLPIYEAEKDGTLNVLGSTYSPDNEVVYDGTSRPGVRVVSFAPLLKYKLFPLPEILQVISDMGKWGMKSCVEIEFAVNLGTRPKEFAILQMRPLVLSREGIDIDLSNIPEEQTICRSERVLGNGIIDNVYDILMVDIERFDRSKTRETADEIAHFNAMLMQQERPYILIGVGRWGSADPWLGIPVTWDQISGVRAVVESGFEDLAVTPSQGSHFFQNLTSFMVGYFTVNPHTGEGMVDWDWLMRQPAEDSGQFVRLLHFDHPVVVKMDGKKNVGVILKPDAE